MVFITTTIIFTISLLLLGATPSYAWGPAFHIEVAREILASTALLPIAVRTILDKYPFDFYYGNISADIVVGKNLTSDMEHCHNWRFGFKLLKNAKTDSQIAFAYGYMCHLSSDTIAHNHFIPEKIIRTYSTRMHRHIYWEMRIDALVDKSVWSIPAQIEESVHSGNDELLSATLTGTALPFTTSKRIFNRFLSVVRVQRWHDMMDTLSDKSIWTLEKQEKEFFFELALTYAMGLLQHGVKAPCVLKDPKGYKNLASAEKTRKKLKSMRRKNKLMRRPNISVALEMEEALKGISISMET